MSFNALSWGDPSYEFSCTLNSTDLSSAADNMGLPLFRFTQQAPEQCN